MGRRIVWGVWVGMVVLGCGLALIGLILNPWVVQAAPLAQAAYPTVDETHIYPTPPTSTSSAQVTPSRTPTVRFSATASRTPTVTATKSSVTPTASSRPPASPSNTPVTPSRTPVPPSPTSVRSITPGVTTPTPTSSSTATKVVTGTFAASDTAAPKVAETDTVASTSTPGWLPFPTVTFLYPTLTSTEERLLGALRTPGKADLQPGDHRARLENIFSGLARLLPCAIMLGLWLLVGGWFVLTNVLSARRE